MDQLVPFEQKWKILAEQARDEAARRPAGRARDAILKKAESLERSIAINELLNSKTLHQPHSK
ncbi:MAG: hypothetical protein J0G95_12255 [Rhizobiales bacterium]|nr:hypothetical protein [Hyphomicrobiales bacterium]